MSIHNQACEQVIQEEGANQKPKVTRDWLLDKLLAAEAQNLTLRQNIVQIYDDLNQQRMRVDAETEGLRQRVHELSVGTHIEVFRRNAWEGEPPRKMEILSWGSSGGKTLIHVQ